MHVKVFRIAIPAISGATKSRPPGSALPTLVYSLPARVYKMQNKSSVSFSSPDYIKHIPN